MEIPRLAASASADEVVQALETAGATIVERLVAPDTLDAVMGELGPALDATTTGSDQFSGRRTRRTGALIARSATCRELVMHPLVVGAAHALLRDSTSIHLHLTQMIAIGPGEPGQLIHRDQWAFDFFPFPTGYEVQCNTIWAMHDFTAANGATRVIPGSHRLADRQQFSHDDAAVAEMPKGSVLIYTGAVYHGGGANTSEHVRYGLNITYARSWLRQEENQYLAVPHDIARTLPEPLLRMMGYARGAYALGYVDDLRDPLDVLLGRPQQSGLGNIADATRARARG